MFTSRAEYRILLRQDNADERLTKIGYKLGLTGIERTQLLEEKEVSVNEIISFLSGLSVSPKEINGYLETLGTSAICQKGKAINIAARPQVNICDLILNLKGGTNLNCFNSERFKEIAESAEIRIKYEGYIVREKIIAEKIVRLESLKIPEDVEYSELVSISTEGRQKLERIRPVNIGQAGRISGVSPADISILLMYLGR
jgi:tRNA uridine 5-carboxymethylaminomethyl modification enzyme